MLLARQGRGVVLETRLVVQLTSRVCFMVCFLCNNTSEKRNHTERETFNSTQLYSFLVQSVTNYAKCHVPTEHHTKEVVIHDRVLQMIVLRRGLHSEAMRRRALQNCACARADVVRFDETDANGNRGAGSRSAPGSAGWLSRYRTRRG